MARLAKKYPGGRCVFCFSEPHFIVKADDASDVDRRLIACFRCLSFLKAMWNDRIQASKWYRTAEPEDMAEAAAEADRIVKEHATRG